jgi:O-antigen/teichoic acid export membrane protein
MTSESPEIDPVGSAGRGGGLVIVGLSTFVKAIILSGSVVLSQIIARMYGAETLGYFSTAMSAILLMSILFQYGAPTLYLRNVVSYEDHDHTTLYRSLVHAMLLQKGRRLFLVACVVTLGFYVYLTGGGSAALIFCLLLPFVIASAWLQLRAVYLRATGQRLLAALADMGILNVVLVVAALLFWNILASPGLMTSIFAVAVGVTVVTLWRCVLTYRDITPVPDTTARRQQQILLQNGVLLFLYRNGYPLLFAVFASSKDIGLFRLEERLAFSVMFLYLLFELFSTKALLRGVKNSTPSQARKTYLGFAAIALGPATVASLGLAGLSVLPGIREFFHLAPSGFSGALVFLAIPFYVAIQYNALLLNIRGYHRAVTLSMVLVVALFCGLSFAFYSFSGLDGLRLAYFLAAVSGSLWSTFLNLHSMRTDSHAAS